MDVFTQARAELSLLEDKERRLRKELLDVRTAITTQRAKITELLRTRAAAINHLPTEILLFIFDLDVHSNPYPGRNYELAAVCRRWRDVVLDSPSLWTTIHVTIHVADLKPSSIITNGAVEHFWISSLTAQIGAKLTISPTSHRCKLLVLVQIAGVTCQ